MLTLTFPWRTRPTPPRLFCLLALLPWLALCASAVRAATLTVTSLADSGNGSLRAAITQANTDGAGGAYDTITFSLPTGSVITVGSTLTVTAPMTIQGPGAASLAIDGGNTNGNTNVNGVGVFTLSGGTASQPVALSGLTIQHGSAGVGGGVSVSSGTVSLTDCVLTHDVALIGGGVSNGGTLTLTGCTFADSYGSLFGGGLANGGTPILATATLTDCTFTDNTSSFGGGLYNSGADSSDPYDITPGGTVSLTGCTFTGNFGSEGYGGLYNTGTATLSDCGLAGNSSYGDGGGLGNGGQATLINCALVANSCVLGGGDGGGLENGGTVTLVDCSLTNNSAQVDFAPDGLAFGGGGVSNSGTATLTGCVLSANGAALKGGGLDNKGGTATLTGCTLAGNSADTDEGPMAGYGGGGGVNVGGGTVYLTDDILYGDGSPNGAEIHGAVTASDCDVQQPGFGQTGFPATPDANGNRNADPLFVSGGDLHLQSGSPCAGTGTTSVPNNSYLPYDLDGRPRPTPPYTAPSLGAYEAAPTGAYGLVVESASDGGAYTRTDYNSNGPVYVTVPFPLPRSLRTAVQCADDYPDAAITFDPAVFTSRLTILLTGAAGTLPLSQPMSITGPAAGVAVDGGYNHATNSGGVRIFDVTAGTPADPVGLRGLTLQNGNASNSGQTGGGGLLNNGGAATLTDCALTGNVATDGGGLSNIGGGAATLTNCVLADNSAGAAGGGLLNYAGTATLTECTFTGNSAGNAYGGLANLGTALLTDDILYGDPGGEIGNISGGTATVIACDIQQSGFGQTGSPATPDANGNFDADPQFVSQSDLAVKPGSPAVGAGTPDAPHYSYSPYDITGRRRANPPTVGAYEGTPAATHTGLALTTGTNPSAVGQSVTFTATVTVPPRDAPPAGSVSFYVDGSHTPAATVALSGATASYATSGLAAGRHTVTATFTGTSFVPSSSDPLAQTVLAPPTANAQTVSVPFNRATDIRLTGSDPNSPAQALTYAIATPPQHGSLSGTGRDLTYRPNAGYHGSDSFTFTVSNAVSTSAAATVTLNVAAGVPTANAQSVTTNENTSVGITPDRAPTRTCRRWA